MSNRIIIFTTLLLALACFELSPAAQPFGQEAPDTTLPEAIRRRGNSPLEASPPAFTIQHSAHTRFSVSPMATSVQVSVPGRFLPTQQVKIRPLVLARFSAIPPDPTTRPTEHSRSLATLPGPEIRRLAIERCLITTPATAIQPLVLTRFRATPAALPTRQPVVARSRAALPVTVTRPAVLLRSLTTLTASKTRPTVVPHSFSTLPATIIQRAVLARSRAIRLEATTQLSAGQPASISRVVAMSVSAKVPSVLRAQAIPLGFAM